LRQCEAAKKVEEFVSVMLGADASDPVAADRALSAAAELEVQLFTELRSHVDALQ